MWVTKLLIFPVEIRIFCPKTTKFGPKLAFLINLGQAMQAYSMPCCESVGGCGARAVSRKTPVYFMYHPLLTSFYFHLLPLLYPCCCLVWRQQRLHRPLFPFSSFSTLSSFPRADGTCHMQQLQHIASTAPFIPDTVPSQLGRSDAVSVNCVTVI